MGCEWLDAGYEDYPALVWRRGEERNELVGEQVMAKDVGCKDLPERRLMFLALTTYAIGIPGACLSRRGLAGGTQLVGRVGE